MQIEKNITSLYLMQDTDSEALPDFLSSSGPGMRSTQRHEYNEELLERKSSGSRLEYQDYGRRDPPR
jgi:hypothetical protein